MQLKKILNYEKMREFIKLYKNGNIITYKRYKR